LLFGLNKLGQKDPFITAKVGEADSAVSEIPREGGIDFARGES
jgi:hypothetical protein